MKRPKKFSLHAMIRLSRSFFSTPMPILHQSICELISITLRATALLILLYINNLSAEEHSCNHLPSKSIDSDSCNLQVMLFIEVSQTYEKLKSTLFAEDSKILEREQLKWKVVTDQLCAKQSNTNCLTNEYKSRIKILNLIAQQQLPPLSEINAVCKNAIKDKNKHKHIFSSKYKMIGEKLKFDINNDGIEEYAETCDGGTMHVPCLEYKTFEGTPVELETIGFEWKHYWTYYSSYFSYHKRTYNLEEDDDGPSHIQYTTPKNKSYAICEYENIRTETFYAQPETVLNKEICKLAENKQLNYIELNQKSLLTHQDLIAMGRHKSVVSETGYVDINNDGLKEHAGAVTYAGTAGRGCDYLYYDELSKNGKGFKKEQKNSPLLSMQEVELESPYPNCCGVGNKLFKYKNKIYYEMNTDRKHKISILEKSQFRDICTVKRTTKTKVKTLLPPYDPFYL